MRKRDKVTRDGRIFELALRFGWVCWFCNIPLPSRNHRMLDSEGKRVIYDSRSVSLHVDHIIPKSQGGSDDISNLALACEFCNRARLNMSVETYLTWLDRVRFGDTWSPIRDGKR